VGERLAELGVVGLTVLCVCETFNFPSTALLCLRVFLCVCKGANIYIYIYMYTYSACVPSLSWQTKSSLPEKVLRSKKHTEEGVSLRRIPGSSHDWKAE
jgi:hypothetical protein